MGGTGRFVKGLDTTEKRVTHFCWARHYWNDDKANSRRKMFLWDYSKLYEKVVESKIRQVIKVVKKYRVPKKTSFCENWPWQILLLIIRNPPSFFLTNAGDSFCNCRSLIKVKFSTDQFRPALGSRGCRLWLCSKTLKTALFQTFSTWHPNTFCPYCLILT